MFISSCSSPRVHLHVGIKVVEVNISATEDELMTGSAMGNETQILRPFPSSDSNPFPILTEQPGQMYAYRISRSEVLLGTRRLDTLGASVGIGPVAQGQYQCIARNAIVNNSLSLSISVKGRLSIIYRRLTVLFC